MGFRVQQIRKRTTRISNPDSEASMLLTLSLKWLRVTKFWWNRARLRCTEAGSQRRLLAEALRIPHQTRVGLFQCSTLMTCPSWTWSSPLPDLTERLHFRFGCTTEACRVCASIAEPLFLLNLIKSCAGSNKCSTRHSGSFLEGLILSSALVGNSWRTVPNPD